MKLFSKFLKIFSLYMIHSIKKRDSQLYEIIEIIEDIKKSGEIDFTIFVRVLNKNISLFMTPEEILEDDYLVDKFSPRDIRTLTYLGYLAENAPKYKILANKLSKNESIKFIIKKSGEKEISVKTAEQIMLEKDIILNMNKSDIMNVCFIAGANSKDKLKEI